MIGDFATENKCGIRKSIPRGDEVVKYRFSELKYDNCQKKQRIFLIPLYDFFYLNSFFNTTTNVCGTRKKNNFERQNLD